MIGGAAVVVDGGPSASGVTACGWRAKSAGELDVQILAPVAFSSAATTAETYYDLMVQGMKASHVNGEEVAGLGEKAYLVTLDNGGAPGSVTTILKSGKIATVSAIGVAKAEALAAARQIAARF